MLDRPTTQSPSHASLQANVEAILGIEPSRASWRRWRAPTIILLAIVVAAGAYVLWPIGGRSAVTYVTDPVTRGNLTVLVTATGSAQPITQVNISSELSGTVRRVLVDYNSPVNAGQPLAELDLDKLNAAVESARAKVEAAKARVAETAAAIEEKSGQYERRKQLAARSISSPQELELAKAAYDRAVAQHANALADVRVAEADLRLSEINLTKACICSPINGVVLMRNVDPGQIVASSLQAPVLFVIAEDLRRMELRVDVDEADVGKVKVGQKATFTVDAYPERKFPAEIRDIRYGSEVVQGVVTYKAILTIDNADLLIRPGMTATAEIVVEEVADALLVPNSAIRFSPTSTQGGGQQQNFLQRILSGRPNFRPPSRQEDSGRSRRIWVLHDGAPAAVPVVVGATDGRRTQIVEGNVAPDQRVIVDAVSARR
jgi:HlyD family secretion protein